MLFDIHKLCWDEKLLSYFDIPRSMLPEVHPSGYLFGETSKFGGNIPIAGDAGDQQAALFGQCCFDAGEVKNTYGTGGFMLMNTGREAVLSQKGLITTIAAGTDDKVQYALEGSVFIAGAAIQWLRDQMRFLKSSAQSEEYCLAVPDSNGVYIVPAFSGLGAPYWEQYARGTIVGLTRGATKEHFVRATVESMAYQTEDLLHAMQEESGLCIRSLRVDGGASANNFLMQFQSDISNILIRRPALVETTALGAAGLAGLTTGFWADRKAFTASWQCGNEFTPAMDAEKRAKLLGGWHRAVRCAIAWAKEED